MLKLITMGTANVPEVRVLSVVYQVTMHVLESIDTQVGTVTSNEQLAEYPQVDASVTVIVWDALGSPTL